MTRSRVLRVGFPLMALSALAGCQTSLLPLSEIRDFTVAGLEGVCEGGTPVLVADLVVKGYERRDIQFDASALNVSSPILDGSDHRVEVNLLVDADAVPDGTEHDVQIEAPTEGNLFVSGETETFDVRYGSSGALTDVYRPVTVTFPSCS